MATGKPAWLVDPLGSARAGRNPTVLTRLESGYAVIGSVQLLPGYCLLLADGDGIDHLTDLPRGPRERFLADMGLLGEAMMAALRAADPGFWRLNYEILGNTDHYLHAHVIPRYAWEPDELRRGPVWRYPREQWNDPAHALAPRHDALRDSIAAELRRVLG